MALGRNLAPVIQATAVDVARTLNAASRKTGVQQRPHMCVAATHDAQKSSSAKDVAGASPAAILLKSTKPLAVATV